MNVDEAASFYTMEVASPKDNVAGNQGIIATEPGEKDLQDNPNSSNPVLELPIQALADNVVSIDEWRPRSPSKKVRARSKSRARCILDSEMNELAAGASPSKK
ncbi:hypothetical protein KSP39_PZI014722 [Platanthera zijinensis]|uniref:Uncharacterized protein n=1 Tax=Platanthera zijinensis TaxID=2320716 RepID=A0AAP0BCX4_9ASPA